MLRTGPPISCSSVHILLCCERGRTARRIHLRAESFDLCKSEIRSTALGRSTSNPRSSALGVHLWAQDNIRGCVQIALCMTADKFGIFSKSHIALHDTGTHDTRRPVRAFGVLREHHTRSTVGNRKIRWLELFDGGSTLGCILIVRGQA